MPGLIKNTFVKDTILTSRIFQEAFRIQEGENRYAVLINCMEISQQQIDMFAKFFGTAAGYAVISHFRQTAYHNPDNGKFTNWINRNIYQGPLKTEIRQTGQVLAGTIASAVTEWLIKAAANGVYDYSRKKTNHQALEEIYSFLNNYTLTEAGISNNEKAHLELAKIRNGLPLSDLDKKKIHESGKKQQVIALEDYPSMSVLNNNSQLAESLAYHLFDLYCQKFGDNEGILAQHLENRDFTYKGMDTLLSYYDYLGFTGKHAQEMIRVNANRYDTICRDQKYYLQLGRLIIKKFSLDIPNVSIDQIYQHCNIMTQYDPYQLRRKKVQNTAIGFTEGLAGLLLKRPDIVLNGGSLALSQFQLEDGTIPTIMEREFKKNGIDLETYKTILDQSKEISETVNNQC